MMLFAGIPPAALTFAVSKRLCIMNKKEEYTDNPGRDWLIFGVSTVAMIALLFIAPEWVWVTWPFLFTALAGALGRL